MGGNPLALKRASLFDPFLSPRLKYSLIALDSTLFQFLSTQLDITIVSLPPSANMYDVEADKIGKTPDLQKMFISVSIGLSCVTTVTSY